MLTRQPMFGVQELSRVRPSSGIPRCCKIQGGVSTLRSERRRTVPQGGAFTHPAVVNGGMRALLSPVPTSPSEVMGVPLLVIRATHQECSLYLLHGLLAEPAHRRFSVPLLLTGAFFCRQGQKRRSPRALRGSQHDVVGLLVDGHRDRPVGRPGCEVLAAQREDLC